MKTKTLFITILLMIVSFSCNKDEDPVEEPVSEDLAVFNISEQSETGWNFVTIAKDGGYLIIDKNEENGMPKEVFFRPIAEHKGYSLQFDNNGYPKSAVIENFIFLFCNFTGTKFDIAVIIPPEFVLPGFPNYHILRDLDAGINLAEFFAGLKSDEELKGKGFWKKTLKVVGVASSAAACGVGVATAATGVGLGLAAIGCGATAVNLGILPDKEILGVSPSTIGNVATVVGCFPVPDAACVLGLVSIGCDQAGKDISYINNEPTYWSVYQELCYNCD